MIICVQCRTSNRDGTRYCRRCGAFLTVQTPQDKPPVEPLEAAPPEEPHQLTLPEVEKHDAAPPVVPHDEDETVELRHIVLPVEPLDAEPQPKLSTTLAEESSRDIADKSVLPVIPERKEELPPLPPIFPVQPPPAPPTDWRLTAAIAVGAAVVSGWAGYQIAGSTLGRQLREATAQIRELNIALNVRQKNLEQQASAVAGLQYELEKAQHAAPAETQPQADHLAQENQILRGQIRQSDTTIARLQERLRRDEAGAGRRQSDAKPRTPWGELTWTGDPGAGGVVVAVSGSKAKPGSLQGKLPGLDCTVEPEDPKLVTVLTPLSAPQWNQLAFRVGSGGKKTVVHLRLACLAKQ